MTRISAFLMLTLIFGRAAANSPPGQRQDSLEMLAAKAQIWLQALKHRAEEK